MSKHSSVIYKDQNTITALDRVAAGLDAEKRVEKRRTTYISRFMTAVMALVVSCLFAVGGQAFAQTCAADEFTEINTIYDQDFGTGPDRSSDSFVQNLRYRATDSIPDGFYAIGSSNSLSGHWMQTVGNVDADGNTDGRYLGVNMFHYEGDFYRIPNLDVSGVAILRFETALSGTCINCRDIPEFTLILVDSVTGTTVASFNSASIGVQNDGLWYVAADDIVVPSGVTSVDFILRNSQPVGRSGNDVGVDNIRLSSVACYKLDVSKSVPSNADQDASNSVTLGDTLTYTVTVENSGDESVSNVVVSDPMLTPNSVTCSTLAVGETCVLTGTHIVTQAEADAGEVVNTASVISDEITDPVDSNTVTTPVEQDPAVTNVKSDAALDTDADNNGEISEGDTVEFVVTVTNTGNVTLKNVVVEDAMLTPSTETCTTLAVGDTCVLTGTYVVTAADVAAGEIINTASVTSDEITTAVPSNTVTTPILAPALGLAKAVSANADEDGNGEVSEGDTLTYTVTMSNTGDAALTNVVVNDSLITPNTTNCALVASGDTCVLTGTYVVTAADVAAGEIVNNATANSDQTGEVPAAHTAPLNMPAMALAKGAPALTTDADANGEISEGDLITYTVTLSNTGTMTLSNIVVEDTMLSPTTETCATLAPGADCVLTGTYTVTAADVTAGEIINNATANSDQLPEATASNTEPLNTPALEVVKPAPTNADEDGDGFVSAGDTLTYTVTMTNTGTATLSNVIVSDNLIDPNSNTCASVAPGATCELIGIYVVTQADVDGGAIDNEATADSAQTDPSTATNTVTIAPMPSMELAKVSVETDFTMVGDTIDYTYDVVNTGNVTITGLSVSDDKIATVSCPVTTLLPGESTTCEATYTITQADLDAGFVTNNASATGTPPAGTLVDPTDSETVLGTQSPALTTVKTAIDTDFAAVGETIDYNYTVTNSGNVTITDPISVTDDKIASVTCPALPAGGLAPLASITCTGTYTVTQADLDAGSVTNIASSTDGNVTSPEVTETVTGTQSPAMTLDKVGVDTSYNAVGDIINYEYTVENTGNVLIADLVVTDDLISTVTCNVSAIGNGDANLDPGEVVICTANYTVTQDDIDNGSVTNNASATGTPPGGTLTDPTDAETVNAEQLPELTMVKAAVETTYAVVGDTIDYNYTIENTGNVYVANLSVTDDKISNVTCDVTAVGNNDANLDPGETVICTATYTVTQADIDAGAVTNNAEATGDPAGGTLDPATADETVDATQTPAMETVKTATDVQFQLPGDITTYDYVVTNTGNTTITDPITVTDNRIPSVTCPALPAGGLAPGASITCTGEYVVTQADLDIGSVTNIASATDGTTTSPTASETIPADQDPAMTIAKAANFTDFTTAGEVVTYDYTVTNSGNLTITTDIDVTDDKIGTFTCHTGNLVPGASHTCTASYTITQADVDAGSVTNQAFATSGPLVAPPVDVTVDGTQTPAMTFAKRATVADFTAAGDVLTYEFDVANTGNVTLTNISISDSITTVTCPQSTLLPTEDMVCTASYTVTQADVDAGEVLNTADASATPPSGPALEPTDSATVGGVGVPGIDFTKTALDTSFATVGDILNYDLVVENTGPITLSNVTVTDDLAAVSCPFTVLAPAQSMTCSASYTVTQADIDAGSLTNNAAVTSELPGGVAGPGGTDSAVVDAVPNPVLNLDKAPVDTTYASPGDVLNYTYVVSNDGNVTINNIVVTDDLIPSLSCPATTLAPTESMTCTGQYSVTQDDIDNGSVTNVAGADGTPTQGALVPPTDTVTVDGEQLPALGMDKIATTSDFDMVGDILTYDYVVTNTGNVTLTNAITVSDDKIASVNCPALPVSGLVPGAAITCTAQYVVTQADIDAGEVVNVASATDGTTTSPTDTETVDAVQAPALDIVKTATTPTFAAVGDTVDYEYEVFNTGNTTIIDAITVSDDKIASVNCPALPAGGLAPTASIVCTATYTVTQADIDAGGVTNIASATDGNVTSPNGTETVPSTQNPAMEMVKSATNVEFTLPGDITTYDYVVTNTGNTTLTAPITVTDNLISNVTCPALPVGGLAPGAFITCTGEYAATQADLDLGSVTNVASAASGPIVSPVDSETIPANAEPALTMRKSSADTTFNMVGEILTYTFEVENTGNVTLTGDTEIVDNKIGTFVCFSGNLVPGAVETCTATYEVTQEDIDNGSVTNDAYATNPRTASPPDSVTIDASQEPALGIVKTAITADYSMVGEVLDYEYEVTNTGNTTIVLPISVNDDRIPVVTCPDLPTDGLAPDAAITCTASYTVTQADIDAGSVTNVASATDGQVGSPVDNATVEAVQTPSLDMDKVATSADFTNVGDVLTYDYIVTNSGNTTIIDPITVSDDKIPSTSCPALPAGGLIPGAAITCTGSYTVTQADLDAGGVTNVASATDGNTVSPTDTVNIGANQLPALSIDKSTPATDFTAAGEVISYSYVVTNTGNTTITDAISVSDDKISNVSCPVLPAGGLTPSASITCTADYTLTQADVDAGEITNIASATDGTIVSPTDTVTVGGTQTPAMSLVKSATTESFSMPGDIVSYEYVVTNTGNVTITDAITVSDDKIANVSCPALPAGGLAPSASLTCSADYEATQADIDAGSVTNIAGASAGGLSSPEATETVEATVEPRLTITKEATDMVQAFGPLYDVTYAINVENTGNVTLNDFQVSDDLVTALAPATMFNTPVVTVSNITGATANSGYDGATDVDLMSGTPVLNVGDSGVITITVRIDTTNGAPAQPNTATSSSAEMTDPVPSNPAFIEPQDRDGDGTPDYLESCSEDRDGDGIPDCEDYDPTGYFYCEENGQILAGGGITVTGPNGSNSAIGSANDIVIVQDGSDGYFQFYVTAPGTYTLTPTYPSSGAPSTDRLVENSALDVTSFLPSNPGILGSSEFGATGILADYSAASNTPFYFEFDIEAGDPSVFMNNIPLQHCGRSELALNKTVIGDPIVQSDGSQIVTYEFEVTNSGQTQVDNVQLTDDLGSVYGDANVIVNSNEITVEPADFTGDENTDYDGVIDINLLNGLGSLEAGEVLTVQVQTTVTPEEASTFVNKATVSGADPLTGEAIDPADATAEVDLIPAAKVQDLVVTKSVRPRTVQIGDPVLYTIEVTNNGIGNISDVEIVDNIPAGFAYIPNSATLSDANTSIDEEPAVPNAGSLVWNIDDMQAAPLDFLAPGETITVNLRLLAGPNVDFGSHENQAYAANGETGERSAIATATVDYIPEPTFDCTPVIGRVYDDVNHNGYPDDGEPGLPGVRLVTVNGDIITTDHFGRYHIPCAIIADSEHGSNFLLKTDVRTLPLGFTPTTENPRVVRATRGKFVKLNFGAAYRPKLRMDIYAADFDRGLLTQEAARRIRDVMSTAQTAERALVVYHAADEQDVTEAQANLTLAMKVIEELAPRTLKDVALEASWDDQVMDEDGDVNGAQGIRYASKAMTREDDKRVNFVSDWRGGLKKHDPVKPALRGGKGSKPLAGDDRDRNVRIYGRQDHVEEQTARPGRLQRWTGWADTMSSYAEGPEVETTVDSLDPVKRLNAQANVVAQPEGRMVMAEAYHNYNAFTEKLEVRLFDADRSVRGEPLAVMPVRDGYAKLAVDNRWPEDLVYVLRAYGTDGDFDETAPKRLMVGDPDYDLSPEGWSAESYTAFGQNTLVKDNVTVRGGAVRVYGRNISAEEVGVMGQRVRVDENGRFVAEQLLPAGQQQVELWLPGTEAGVNRTVRMVDVKSRDTFYVAQAEATIGQRQSDDDTFTDGRLAFYVRSRLNDRWAFTATADTGEAPIEDLLKGLDDKDVTQLLRRLDPDRYYPVYGDDSTIEQDAPTSGRIYARLERDDDYLLWGNYQTNFNDTEFGRIQRTLYGAKFHWDENAATRYGDARTEVTAYLAEGGTRQGRDELQGTGGSVYYLRHGDISIGSEILRIETRDVVSGLVLESRRLTYGTDYDMDFIQGRVILNRPLSSTSNDGRLFRDGTNSGNEEILVADYEFTPIAGSEDATIYGARASRWLGDLVKLGATYNKGDNNGAESELVEFDATLQLAAGTYIKGEIAQSSGQGVETYRSIDGGFSYNPIERGGNLAGDNEALAYAVEAATDLNDLFDADGRIHAYWRKREAGFAGYAESTNKDIEQYGGGMRLNVFDELSLQARADIIEDDTIGTNSFAEASAEYALNDNIKIAAGLSYSDDDRGNKGTSVGARAEYNFDDDSKIYVFGQAGLDGNNVRTTDRAGVGGEWRIGQRVFLGGEVSGGEDGLGARISGRYAEEDGDEYYLAYDLPLNSQVGAEMGTFNMGARHRFSDALSVYGEERFMFNDRGLGGLTHAYGVDYKPGNWRFGLSGELGDIGDLERQALSASVGFNDDRMQAGATAEYREDENTNSGDVRRTWLLRTTALYQMNDELRLQGKLNWAHSDQPTGTGLVDDFQSAEFTEASVAAAYRPIWDDRLNVLAKAVYLYDLSPSVQRFNGEAVDFRQKSSIYSVDASYDFHPRWTLGAKYGHRSGYVTDGRESEDFYKSRADLGVIRLDYHLTHRWDATLEGRYLDIGNGTITREGGLAMLYRHINDNAKIGVGLTYGGIDQEYLLADDDKDVGWLVNVVGKF